MKKILLSLAPVSIETLKSLIQRSPGVPEFEVVDGHDLSGEELATAFAKADVVLGSWTFQRIGKDLVTRAGSLKLIQQPSIGYDNIDIKACSERRILVANSPTGNVATVAEHTIAMALALVRKLVRANAGVRAGRWDRLTLAPSEIGGKTWGVVGFGEIGRAVALRLRPFGLAKVLYAAPRQAAKEVEEQYGVEYSPLPMLLKASDIVSLHVPLTDSTRNLIDAGALSSMKSGAYLINLSRGGVVDEAALADALLKQLIAGAATDVFVEEPLGAADPLLKVPEDKILFSPHIAGMSPESMRRILTDSAENIARALAGHAPLHVVNPSTKLG
jgi:phosphoglycerate dehydrogenase-like enzyme